MDEPKSTDLSIVPVKPDAALVATLTHEFDFQGASGASYETYSIAGKPLVETSTYKLVITKLPTGQFGLVMMASKPEFNYLIEKQTHILTTLQEIADSEDAEAKIKPNYGAFFPKMIEMMESGEDAPRTGVVMGYIPAIVDYKQLVPLTIALKNVRVDLQTAVWMLGKGLKVLDFVHALGFAVNNVDETNILIETALHGVFILNWMDALEDGVTDEDQKADVVALANIVWRAAGGTDAAEPPFDEKVMSKEGHDDFVLFLKRLMSGDFKTAVEEMAALYAMADRIWARVPDPKGYNADGMKRPFHDWVTYPVK